MGKKIKSVFVDFNKNIKEIPPVFVAIFSVCLVAMNILSNKTIYESYYLCIDGGFLISWLPMLIIDMLAIHFGPKKPITLTIFGILINLATSLLFFLASLIPTKTDYSALNTLLGGTWFILLSSSVALLVSSIVNSIINYTMRKLFINNEHSKMAFFTRSVVSSLVSQFVDNLIFSVLTFMVFAPIFWNGFSWTIIQCLTCSSLFALLEVILELLFLPIGYKIEAKWRNREKELEQKQSLN